MNYEVKVLINCRLLTKYFKYIYEISENFKYISNPLHHDFSYCHQTLDSPPPLTPFECPWTLGKVTKTWRKRSHRRFASSQFLHISHLKGLYVHCHLLLWICESSQGSRCLCWPTWKGIFNTWFKLFIIYGNAKFKGDKFKYQINHVGISISEYNDIVLILCWHFNIWCQWTIRGGKRKEIKKKEKKIR